jgi:hypothetical protein
METSPWSLEIARQPWVNKSFVQSAKLGILKVKEVWNPPRRSALPVVGRRPGLLHETLRIGTPPGELPAGKISGIFS